MADFKQYYINRLANLTAQYEDDRAELIERLQAAEEVAATFDRYAEVYGELGIAPGEHEAALNEIRELNQRVPLRGDDLMDILDKIAEALDLSAYNYEDLPDQVRDLRTRYEYLQDKSK